VVRKAATLTEMLAMLLVLFCALSGVLVASRLAAGHGVLLAVACGALGFLAGAVAGIIALFIIVVAVWVPRDVFWQWWRPYPPPCENGTCRRRDYRIVSVPEADRKIEGLSPIRWICKCGHVYASGTSRGLEGRWVRVLPEGKIRPYLKHRFAGRWRPDR